MRALLLSSIVAIASGCFVNDVFESGTAPDTGGGGASPIGGSGGSSDLGGAGGAGASGAGGAGGAGGEGGSGGAPCEKATDEQCEDCNDVDGDGCTNHTLDDRWYCPEDGSFCWALSGVELTEGPALSAFGGNGGSGWSEACPPGHALVGLDALLEDTNQFYAIRMRCALIELDEDGNLTWSTAITTGGTHGGNGSGDADPPPIDCPVATFWVGYRAHKEGSGFDEIEGLELRCAGIRRDGVAYTRDAAEFLPVYGLATQSYELRGCPDGMFLDAIFGKEGGYVDQIGARCLRATPTYCGDGIMNGGETCDDANIDPDDGCDFCKAVQP